MKYKYPVNTILHIKLFNNNLQKIDFTIVKTVIYNKKYGKKNPTKIILLDWEDKILNILDNNNYETIK